MILQVNLLSIQELPINLVAPMAGRILDDVAKFAAMSVPLIAYTRPSDMLRRCVKSAFTVYTSVEEGDYWEISSTTMEVSWDFVVISGID